MCCVPPFGKRLSILLPLLFLLVPTAASLASDAAVPIRPEQAREYEGKLVVVTMTVKSSKDAREHRETVFLDSEKDFMDQRNLGIAIRSEAIRELEEARRITTPDDYFLGKRIRVTGKVVIREDRPYIDVRKADRIELLDKR